MLLLEKLFSSEMSQGVYSPGSEEVVMTGSGIRSPLRGDCKFRLIGVLSISRGYCSGQHHAGGAEIMGGRWGTR